ncbi:MAG: alpha/beta fold hydrolase [Armatimonadetes bacterium]|nr:alpha/beta fold hydrolase [Armatimonadota bacterium]
MLWLAILLGLYLAILCGAAYISVHPYRIPYFESPGSLGAPQESVSIPSRGGALLPGWWCEGEPDRPVVILCHGYMMNRSEPASVAYWFWKQGCSTLNFDFPAHGRSPGKRSGLGYPERKDVLAAVEWVRSRSPEARVILWGSSMGAAACSFAAAEDSRNIVGLILDSAFSRLLDATDGWWHFIGGRWLAVLLKPLRLFSRWILGYSPSVADVGEALAKIHVPVLLIHGESDTLAVPDQARRNQGCMTNTESSLEWFAGCNHSEARWLHPEKYRTILARYLMVIEKLREQARGQSPSVTK